MREEAGSAGRAIPKEAGLGRAPISGAGPWNGRWAGGVVPGRPRPAPPPTRACCRRVGVDPRRLGARLTGVAQPQRAHADGNCLAETNIDEIMVIHVQHAPRTYFMGSVGR